MTCLDGLEWLVGGAERCRVRIGSHGDDVSGLGMLDWLGGGLLCEDLLTWWRCGRLWKRRFGLGHLCRGGRLAALTSTGQSSPAAGHGRDEGMR